MVSLVGPACSGIMQHTARHCKGCSCHFLQAMDQAPRTDKLQCQSSGICHHSQPVLPGCLNTTMNTQKGCVAEATGDHCQSVIAYHAWREPCSILDNAQECVVCRSLAKDGVNRSFAAVYDGRHSPEAAKDAAERLHPILQREDAVVAKNSGKTFQMVFHIITLHDGTVYESVQHCMPCVLLWEAQLRLLVELYSQRLCARLSLSWLN